MEGRMNYHVSIFIVWGNGLSLFLNFTSFGLAYSFDGGYGALQLSYLGRFLGAKGALYGVITQYGATYIRNSRYGLYAQLASELNDGGAGYFTYIGGIATYGIISMTLDAGARFTSTLGRTSSFGHYCTNLFGLFDLINNGHFVLTYGGFTYL